jgi:hypothetical protein
MAGTWPSPTGFPCGRQFISDWVAAEKCGRRMQPHDAKPMARLCEPDVVLPLQFFDMERRQALAKRGEYRLLIAVLEDAVHCFQKNLLAKDKQGQRLFHEAHEWIMTEGAVVQNAPTLSFDYVCEILGIDAAYLRGALRRWCEQQLAHAGRVAASSRHGVG